ncbi:MAG: SDR family oxidoreductase [Deltaproteobacteria bacterium]|nr:SDR family oxidoreductase [Deltaproteobacteria bacterium]
MAGLKDSKPLYLVKDSIGVAAVLAKKLEAASIQVKIVSDVPDDARAVVFLKGIDKLPKKNPLQRALDVNKKAFNVARKCGKGIFAEGGLFVAVQDTDAELVAGDTANRVWSAGLGALVKTAAWEWPKASVKSIDIVCKDRGADDLAQSIFEELVSGGPETEVFLGSDATRYSIEAVEEQVALEPTRIGDGDTIVVSGGARGVTAACLIELSKKAKLNIAILARTKLVDEPEFLKSCQTDAAIKQGLLKAAKERGENLTPLELSARAEKILSCREVRENLTKMEENGSRVEYYSVDVCDAAQVAKVLEEVRGELGGIDVLIHAAGILADKLIHEKTDEQFEKVFSTKVVGFKNLLQATAGDVLSGICCFSSVAARTGNVGQVDYAMANEVLNQVCRAQALERDGKCLVKSINWGPWEGGMVRAELKTHFESMGVTLIPLEAGAGAFVDELVDAGGKVEVVIGTKLDTWSAPKEKSQEIKWDLWVQKEKQPFLASHEINGVAVVPIVMVNEWCLRLASALFPKKTLRSSQNLKVLKGIVLKQFRDGGDWFEITCKLDERDGETGLHFALSSSSGIKHYSLEVVLDDRAPLIPPAKGVSQGDHESWNWTRDLVYKDKLFHGKDFQVIRELDEFSLKGCSGILSGGNHLDELKSFWKSDVALLDGGLQLALLWMLQQNSKESLPAAFESLTLYKDLKSEKQVRCELAVVESDAMGARCDITYTNPQEEVLAEFKGLQIYAYGV